MGEKRKYWQTGSSMDRTNGHKKQKPSLFTQSGENVPGIIKRVILKDFMVHSDFTWEPCYNVNFITGSNGSGKSSLLQGIVIGLMSDAKHTKRYKRLTEFIKRGASKAVIKISIFNAGESPYNLEKYGPLITFSRTLHASGSSSMQLLDHKSNVVYGISKAAKEEGKRILQHFDIQIDNPLTVLQQDHAKEMLRVEKPEKLFEFFESATLIKQAREQYQNAHTEIVQLKAEVASQEKQVELVKDEANLYTEQYNKATRNALRDQEFSALHKEKSWARLIKAKEILQSKLKEQESLKAKVEESKEKIKQFAGEIEMFRKKEIELKVSMDESVSEEVGVREHYEIKKENIRKKELSLKYIDNEIKNIVEKREIYVSEMKILKEMLKTFHNSPLDLEAITQRIKHLEMEERKLELKKDKAVLEREKVDKNVFTNEINIKNKCYEILNHKNSLQQLVKEQQEIIVLQSSKDELAVYPRASQVQQAIESNCRKFRIRPLGPVGRFLRVRTHDNNLTSLIETELGNKILGSYLCDNDNDRNVVDNLLNQVYSGGRGKPMIFTSKFLQQRHKIIKPAELKTVLDLVDIVGTEDQKTVVFNFLVDVKQVEAVVVVDTQTKAKNLTTFAPNVPKGLGYCITMDWYKFIPPTHNGSYRSYYVQKKNGVGLLNTSMRTELEEKKEEVRQSKSTLTNLESEKAKLQSVKNGLDEQSRKVRMEIDVVRKELLEVGVKVRKEKSSLEDQGEPDNIERQIEDKTNEVKQMEMNAGKKNVELKNLKSDIEDAKKELEFMGEEVTEINKKIAPLTTELNGIEAKMNSIDKMKTREGNVCHKLDSERYNFLTATKKLEKQIVLIEAEARKLTNNVELSPSASLEKIQAKINQMAKEKLTRKEQGNCMALKVKYDDLLENYEVKRKKLKALRQFCKELESMETKRMEIFNQIKLHTIRMVERRFSQLAEEGKMAMDIMLRVDHRSREISFVFGSGKSSKGDISTLSGGEKSYAQLCLILSLWHFMHTPFRCLDEWDVFLDAVNRKSISQELLNFAMKKEGEIQFIFISPQGALEVPNKKSVKIFQMGSISNSMEL